MVKNKLLIVSILLVLIAALFVIPVFAEVNYDSLVNFNQYSKFNKYVISGTTGADSYLNHNTDNFALTFNNTHKYCLMGYFDNINNNNATQFTLFFNTYTIVHSLTTTTNYFILDSINNFDFARIFTTNPNSTFNISVTINLIDLTQMFGAGNEPTLDECKNLFPTYYPYNEGEVISFLSFDSYNKGVQSVYDSLSYSLNASSSYNGFDSSYSISYGVGNIIGSTTLAALNYPVYPSTHGEYILQPTYYQLIVNKFGRMNLGAKINQGSNVKVSGLLSRYNLNSATKVHVGVLSYQNDFISIYSIHLPALPENKLVNYINFSFNVQMPIDTDSLFFYIDGLNVNSSTTYFYLGDIQVETKDLNTQFLIDQSYNNGYNLGFNQGSESSYNNGYNAGYNKGLENANQNTFLTLFTSVIEAPVNAVLSIFDFEVLGYNLKGFFVGLFSMALLLAIIRLFI